MTEFERIDLAQLERYWNMADLSAAKLDANLRAGSGYEINLPKVIAELKRCYDEIDKLNRALSAINAVHFPKK